MSARITKMMKGAAAGLATLWIAGIVAANPVHAQGLRVGDGDTLEAPGLSVLLYHNAFHGVFSDQKLSGLEMILHGERIATNGDVRLLVTPEQWDPIPQFEKRVREGDSRVIATCAYPDHDLRYRLSIEPEEDGFRIAVHLDRALPEILVGRAGFNLELLPSAYFGKSYAAGTTTGVFPRHPGGPMQRTDDASGPQAQPLAKGSAIVVSPEDPLTRIAFASDTGPVMLFDGRNRAQNGWFVLRSLLPAGRTENAIVWHVRPHRIPGWTRPPVVAFNQVGYTPARSKVAVIELDPAFDAPRTARVLRVDAQGNTRTAFEGAVAPWGRWLRYDYARFDFSALREPGAYFIEYAGQRHGPFRISADAYAQGVWQPSLDTFLPVQMDHVQVREAYRVWHGASHLDDARQAPAGHQHFDGFSMGDATDSPFAAGEHIPGLDQGGWYDAGDFDIRTESQAAVITDLVLLKELFGVDWDETTIDQAARSVEIRRPDGVSDVIQQVEHGALALVAQYRVFDHAIPGIVAPTLLQYTHIGDGGSKTDNRIYSADLGANQTDGVRSGRPDDRWAFTTRATALDYAAITALAAAPRVLRGHNDPLAEECLAIATRVWATEQGREPALFRSFNTTGGPLDVEEVKATVELLITTQGAPPYRQRLEQLLPAIEERFLFLGGVAVRAIPYMDDSFRQRLAAAARAARKQSAGLLATNPFGVPITEATWGGARIAARMAFDAYLLHKAFPEIVDPEPVLRGFDYVLGCHPVSNVSFVSGVGARSQLAAYGNNRADFAFIPGGMIPGVVIVQPDFPEIKSDWPFLWFENEYVITAASSFMLAANAAHELSR